MNRINKARFLLLLLYFQTIYTSVGYVNAAQLNANNNFAGSYKNLQPKIDNSDIGIPAISNNNLVDDSPMLDPMPDSGPGAPEVQSFTPVDATNLVDLFSGNFSYNIPLIDVGGYPINISYQSGITVAQEASWVGLGWTLNPGVVNRDVRGLPDDFNGDELVRIMNIKPNETTVIGGALGLQVYGFDALGLGVSLDAAISHNTYEGWGIKAGAGASLSAAAGNGDRKLGGSLGLTAGIDSREGGFLEPEIGLSGESGKLEGELGIGFSVSSRSGIEELSIGFERKYRWFNSKSEGSYQFAAPTYTPSINMPMRNSSQLFRGTIGGEVNGVHINGTIYGSYNIQELTSRYHTKKAYGYMYAQNATDVDQLDFNREKDGPYYKEIPNLPVTNFTYDLYNVSANGINEQFRPMRGDVGTLYDPQSSSVGNGMSMGAEVGLGNLVHAGVDITVQNSKAESKKWAENNFLIPSFPFRDSVAGDPLFESVYFKSMGETTAMAGDELYYKLNEAQAIKAELNDPDVLNFGEVKNLLSNNTSYNTTNENSIQERSFRNTSFAYFTASEMIQRGSSWNTLSIFQDLNTDEEAVSRIDDYRDKDHISAVEVINPDGIHFQYAIPAYNKIIREVSFNIGPSTVDEPNLPNDEGFTEYGENDNTLNNSRGENNYFNVRETPAHAYAWLLTGVYSTDYVDVSDDGPTPDDLGTYTKFSYQMVNDNFRWRSSYDHNSAKIDERFTSEEEDNIGHYTYGVKELWYLSRIETRNYIAIFKTSDRSDALGVVDENGGIDPEQSHKKLDKIYLYTAQEFYDAEQNAREPLPIKTVHFEYDYSLCLGAPGSTDGKGKLTLKKLWVTNNNSIKEAQSPYVFNYASNPEHANNITDRWGFYKPKQEGALDNERFPYVNQNAIAQNLNTFAWNLTNIILPYGGELVVEYESDAYAYVQDKQAMVMTAVKYLRNNLSAPYTSFIYDTNAAGVINNLYMYFDLPAGVADGNATDLFNCINGISELYFNWNMKLAPDESIPEEVSGFIELDINEADFGVKFGFGEAGVGWIKLDPKEGIHPAAKAGFELIRSELPGKLDDNTYDEQDFLSAAENFRQKWDEVFSSGIENYLINNEFCSNMLPGSYIRLYQPNGNKLGGGSRVRSIRILDHWGAMQGDGIAEGFDFEYGQIYTYETTDPVSGKTISSGVASYEPLVGGDENPFSVPIKYSIEQPLSVGLNLYQLEPIGESFFPAAQVGYSKVKVRNLDHTGVIGTAAGSAIYEFYTAKDFPTKTSQTMLDAIPKDILLMFDLYNKRINAVTVSQGFAIETNNMHGKQKSIRILNNSGIAISGSDYKYQTNLNGELENAATIINPKNSLAEVANLGLFYDVILDARQYINETGDYGAGLNLETSQYGPLTVPIPVILPKVTEGKSEYRGITITKVVHRNGLLSEISTFDNGAAIVTKNLAWDAHTGTVLLSAKENQFGDWEYSLTLPAYWAYSGMGQASKNQGLKIKNIDIESGKFSIQDATSYFTEGDELLLYANSGEDVARTLGATAFATHAWVYRVDGNKIYLIDASGQITSIPNGGYDIKILRSGYKNITSPSAGSIVSLENPISGVGLAVNLLPEKVLNVGTTVYSDFWQTDISFVRNDEKRTCSCATETSEYTSIKSAVSYLLENASHQTPSVTPFIFNGYEFNVVSNNGAMLEVAIKKPDVLTNNCSFYMSTTDGSSLLNYSYQNCKIVWGNVVFDQVNEACSSPNGFTVGCSNGNSIYVYAPCLDLLQCNEVVTAAADIQCGADGIVNPFILGILGNWRPLTAYQILTGREFTRHTHNSGFLTDFQPFWVWENGKGIKKSNQTNQWVRTDSVATMNVYGFPLEVVDALKMPISSYYGHGHTLTAAEAANAHYTDFGFDGFEEYQYYIRRTRNADWAICQVNGHFLFDDPRDFVDFEAQLELIDYLNTSVSHTGKYSLAVSPLKAITISKKVWNEVEDGARGTKDVRVVGNSFTIRKADLIHGFAPRPGKYLVSAWVHEDDFLHVKSNYENGKIVVRLNGSPVEFSASGPIIDGWQQIYGEFQIQNFHTDIEIVMQSITGEVLFDDLRVQPINSSMTAYVYNDQNLQLVASMDEQNFAIFYEYDSGGQLTRQKVETEIGIVTIQEYRSGKFKSR